MPWPPHTVQSGAGPPLMLVRLGSPTGLHCQKYLLSLTHFEVVEAQSRYWESVQAAGSARGQESAAMPARHQR